MSLFGASKNKGEDKKITCACNVGGQSTTTEDNVNKESTCCGNATDGICCVKVLGAGCKSCHELYKYTQEAMKNMNIDVEVEYVTDMKKIMTYGVMSMPALVVNEKVVSMGKVLKSTEIEKLIHTLGF